VGTVTTFSDTTAAPSSTYDYVVKAKDAAGNVSAASNTATATTPAGADVTPPSAPTNLTASAFSSTQVDLSWMASTDNVGVTGYDILRNGAPLASVGATPTTYSDTTASPSTAYSYVVRARDAANNVSNDSNTATVTTPSGSTTTTFIATEDSYTDQTLPTSNFGTATTAYSDNSPLQQAYLKFAVSGVTGTVTSAVLRLYVKDETGNAPALATTSNSWSESTLAWNNQPAAGQVVANWGNAPSGTFVDYPVTAVVTADGTYSFVLVAESTNGMGVATRQSTTNKPQLIVTYG
jgi:chitodextrinase